MTDKPTPTDAELEALLRDKLPASKHYIRPVIEKMVAAMQAAIDKWGQPVVAGDVDRADAVNLARNALTQYDCAITKKGVRVLAEAVLSMDSAITTPQPTQAQAGAVPLDEARRLFDAGWKAAALFCDREDVVADGIIGFGACPQFEAAFSAAQPVAREPLTDEQIKALMQAHRTAMLMTCKARVPECGEFAAIAQDLDWLCESLGIKGGQHGTE